MSDASAGMVPSVVDAQAEVAKAAADLAAADLAAAEGATVHLATTTPWVQYDPGDGLPMVTFEGIDVSETIAEKVLLAASATGMPLRKD